MPTLTVRHKKQVLDKYGIAKGQSLTIGRVPGNDIVIKHSAVSGHHAKIEGLEDGFRLTDLGSTNGTFIGKKYIKSCYLEHEDNITIGEHTIVFAYDDDEEQPAVSALDGDVTKTMIMDERAVYSLTSQVGGPKEDVMDSPVVIEMLEEMPSYMARGIIYLLVFLFVVAIIFSYFGTMDVVVQGRGKLIPQGEAAIVQSAKNGLLKKLYVKEGQLVKRGEALADLDLTRSTVEAEKRAKVYKQQVKQKNCLVYAIKVMNNVLAGEDVVFNTNEILSLCSDQYVESILGLKNAETAYEKAMMQAQKMYPDSIRTLKSAVVNKELNLANKKQQVEAAIVDLSRGKNQLELYNKMYKHGLASKIKLLEEQKKYDDAVAKESENRVALDSAKGGLEDAKIKLKVAHIQYERTSRISKETYALAVLKYQAKLKDMNYKLEALKAGIASMDLDLKFQEFTNKQDRIKAPVTGTISTVVLRTPGEIVKVGATIFTINPAGQPLVAKVMIPNKNIGRIKVGLKAKLKMDAFPYQNYGVLTGRVIRISPDSKKLGAGFFYEITIVPDRDFLKKGKKKYALFTGLTMNAQIVVERKRILDKFLDPIKKLKD